MLHLPPGADPFDVQLQRSQLRYVTTSEAQARAGGELRRPRAGLSLYRRGRFPAVVEERARIARELHDAIAHDVSLIVVQAGAERLALDGAAGSTSDVLQTIERTGRGALTEMRRLVGMLRSSEGESLAPQPPLADLPRLVSQVREAGLPVELKAVATTSSPRRSS